MNKTIMLKWLQEGSISIPTTLLTHYKTLKLTEQELVLLLHINSFLEKGNEFPTPAELAGYMTMDARQCHEMLSQLIKRGFISIIDGNNENGIRFEQYSLEPLWNKLIDLYLLINKQEKAKEAEKTETDLYSCFETEFGRPLSPFEIETLGMWVDDDQHNPTIIKAALREAVISGKINFRYIDRILFEWKKNGIQTIQQAKNHGKKFRQNQQYTIGKGAESSVESTVKSVPFYNWLDQ
ncbi:DnaD domain-containing protein [Niallia sp. NCCP-28]|uniref:DnaD domain-containing protein n=1 Tax=Niallia sp. NCCP-28 TaxID=2934712 RepID=UPI002084A196|nr:DnaD domain-containing protein [Niallia sp. NCCP-28]GKU80977.1 DNA replication protein [Niallia sp. NCCP-28]